MAKLDDMAKVVTSKLNYSFLLDLLEGLPTPIRSLWLEQADLDDF